MPPELVVDLQDIVGDQLRSVFATDHEGYEVLFVRPDIQDEYTRAEIERIHDDVILDGVRTGHLEDMFNAGTFHASAYVFEESALFYYPRDEGSGLVVTVDANCDLPIGEFMQRCRAEL